MLLVVVAVLAAVSGIADPARAKVYLSRDEGLRLAFGDSLRVETRTTFLTDDERRGIRDAARAPFEAARVTWYAGVDASGATRLHGYIDSHPVRTMTETVLIVIDTAGVVRSVEVLAFNEPEDYAASRRWLDLLVDRPAGPRTRPGADLPNISGATLTARALADAVRRAQAIHGVVASPR